MMAVQQRGHAESGAASEMADAAVMGDLLPMQALPFCQNRGQDSPARGDHLRDQKSVLQIAGQ